MEDLQDALENVQYVNAIATQDAGPRPVLPWLKPTEEQLSIWEESVVADDSGCHSYYYLDGLDRILSTPIGMFLFSSYVKDVHDDYVRMNFCEEVQRFKALRRRNARAAKGQFIENRFLRRSDNNQVSGGDGEADEPPLSPPSPPPPRSQINEYDLARKIPERLVSDMEFQCMCNESFDYPVCSESRVGVKGPVLNEIRNCFFQKTIAGLSSSLPMIPPLRRQEHQSSLTKQEPTNMEKPLPPSDVNASVSIQISTTRPSRLSQDSHTNAIPIGVFDNAEIMVVDSLRLEYWDRFVESEHYQKLKQFLWYRDRPVVPDDFFVMRVLGRGGFGLVHACKKGTSGKLYAMKVMNKRRIKMKKSERHALNERDALAAVESSFVVNLKYSFHSKEDVYLILDLMTGGDLGYHLIQKGRFPKRECLYYAARIILGLQALHDHHFVYRDLKPENCLLDLDGRVKISDLGLTTKITPYLTGVAGTRGYWAPEMLRRDTQGRRMSYGHAVDWFSFGCCLFEFISGASPFRSKAALNFGLDRMNKRSKQSEESDKQLAINVAVLELEPDFPVEEFEEDAADLIQKLLAKNETSRLGYNGCEEIMTHAWFKSVDWEAIIFDRMRPPFIPRKHVNAASQSEIGSFTAGQAFKEIRLTDADEKLYKDWDWTNPHAYAAEVIEFLIYERETGKPLLPLSHQTTCCCHIL